MSFFRFIAGFILVAAVHGAAEAASSQEQKLSETCLEISSVASKMMETSVKCMPTIDGNKYSFIIFSDKYLTNDEMLKKNWFVRSVTSVGYTEGKRDHSDISKFCLMDRASSEQKIVYCLPVARAVQLQQAIEAGKIDASIFLDRVMHEMTAVPIPSKSPTAR